MAEESETAPPPAIVAVEYSLTDANVVVRLAQAPLEPVKVVLLANGVAVDAVMVESATAILPLAAPDSATSYSVFAETPEQAGPWIEVVFQAPRLYRARMVDLRSVEVEWSLPAETNIEHVEATLYDVVRDAVVTVARGYATGARLTAPFAMSSTYSVRVRGMRGIAMGPPAELPTGIATDPPRIASAAFESRSGGQVVVRASAPAPSGADLEAVLWSDGSRVSSAIGTSTVTLPVGYALDPDLDWYATLAYGRTVVHDGFFTRLVGPPSPPAGVAAPPPPGIAAVDYDAARRIVTVALEHRPAMPVTVDLFEGWPQTPAAASGTSVGGTTAKIASELEAGQPYTVAVRLETGSWGPPVELVSEAPTLAWTSAYDDDRQGYVQVTWTLPEGNDFEQVEAGIWDADGETLMASGRFYGAGAFLATPTPVAAGFRVRARGVAGVARGPWAELSGSVVSAAPEIQSVVCGAAGGGSTVKVTATTAPPPTLTLGAHLLENGRRVASADGSSGATFAQISLDHHLDPGADWEVELLYRAGAHGRGPAVRQTVPVARARATAIRVEAPELTGSQSVHVEWAYPAGSGAATGALVRLASAAGEVSSARIPSGSGAHLRLAATLDPHTRYEVRLAPLLGSIAEGPLGDPVELISAPPELAALSVDDGQATLRIQSPPHPASELVLSDGGRTLLVKPAGAGGGYVPLPDQELPLLTIAARAVDGVVTGPPSAEIPVFEETPSFKELGVDGDLVKGRVSTPQTRLTDAQSDVFVYADGVRRWGAVAANTDGTFSIEGATGLAAIALRARVSGTAGGVPVSGPLSAAYPIPTMAPEIASATLRSVSASGWRLAVGWEPRGPEATSWFRVELLQAGAVFTTFSVRGFALDQPVANLDVAQPVSVRVRAVGSFGTSPPSAPVTFLPAPVPVTSSQIDGDRVTASWAPPAGAAPTAYRLRLLRQTTTLGWATESESEPTPATTASVALPSSLPRMATCALAVDVAVGAAWSAAESRTLVSLRAPVVKSVEGAHHGGSFRIVWEWPGGAPDDVEEYRFVELLDGRETELAGHGGSSWANVTLRRQPTPATRYAMRALLGSSAGPLTTPLPVVTVPPAVTAAVADGDGLRVEFAGVGPVAAGYRATLLADGQAVAEANVTASPAILRQPVAPGVAYSVTVRALAAGGQSLGPALDALAVVLVPAALGQADAGGGELNIVLTPPDAGGVAPTGYRIDLLRDGFPFERLEDVEPAAGALTVPVGATIDVRGRYALRAYPVVARRVSGPPATADVILGAPEVIGAKVHGADGALTVDVLVADAGLPLDQWLELVAVADGERSAPVTAIDGAAALAVPAGTKLLAIAARATTTGANGPWSDEVRVPLVRPELLARYDGSAIDLTWDADPDGVYLAEARTGGASVAAQLVHGLGVELPLPAADGSAYEARVEQRAGVAIGPPGRLPLVTSACRITEATSTADSVELRWQALAEVTGYQPVLVSDGRERPLAEVDAGHTSTTIPLTDLPGGAELAVRGVTAHAAGPLGASAAVLREAPEDLRLEFDGSSLSASWSASRDPRVGAYEVRLEASGVPTVTARVPGPSYATPLALPAGATAKLSVSAVAGVATGPACDPVAALLGPAPKLTSATVEGATLTLGWSAVPDAPGYDVALRAGGAVVRRMRTTELSAQLELPPGPVTVEVRAASERSAGEPSADLTPLVEAPVLGSAAVDPASGKLTLSWSETAGAQGYTVELTDGIGGTRYTKWTTGGSVEVATGALPSAVLEARVQPGAQDSTGPWSAPATVVNLAPDALRVDWDGRVARAAWEPVEAAVGGYRVTLLDGSTVVGAPLRVTAPAAEIAVAYVKTKALQLVVQPVGLDGPGRPSPRVGLLQPALYANAASSPRRLFRATTTLEPEATVVYLPEIGPFGVGKLPIAPVDGLSTAPLTLEANDDEATNKAFPYKLTIAGPALTFPDPNARIRPGLKDAYVELLEQAEAAAGWANPWGIWILQQAVARHMPQTFDETLYYAYGMSPSARSADLRPGMVLRVASTEFQLMTARTEAPAWSSGYAAGAALDYDVGDYDGLTKGWLVGFDALVAWLAANSIIDVSQPQTGLPPPEGGYAESGAAEAADLFFPSFRRPFFRLLFPDKLQPTTPPASGQTAQQFTIAAADRYAHIVAAASDPPGGVALAYFRGRSVVKPCIRVEIDGIDEVVPIGTTVGNVLDRRGRRPPSTGPGLEGVVLERATGPAVRDPKVPYDGGAADRVRLDWPTLTGAPPRDALMLPLLHGDRLTIGAA
jgi:hypothetical protein